MSSRPRAESSFFRLGGLGLRIFSRLCRGDDILLFLWWESAMSDLAVEKMATMKRTLPRMWLGVMDDAQLSMQDGRIDLGVGGM